MSQTRNSALLRLELCLHRLEQRATGKTDLGPLFIGEGEGFSMQKLKNLMSSRLNELLNAMNIAGLRNYFILHTPGNGRDLQGVNRVDNNHTFHILYYPPTMKYLYYRRDRTGNNNHQYKIFNNTGEVISNMRQVNFNTTGIDGNITNMLNFINPLLT